MTTLHEEPLGGHRSLDEEPEDSYSDSEYAAEYEQERQQNKSMATRSRLTASKTMDSFMDVSSHSNQSYLSYTSSANANMKHLTGLATLSMSSSTSSGYGSQAVSCNNLSNEDIASMRSMSIDETPDFDRVNSNSPPNRQARVNPFLKDMPKAKIQEQPEQQAKKLQEAFTHPLEQLESSQNAQSDDDECAQLPKNNNNNLDLVNEPKPLSSQTDLEESMSQPKSKTEFATDNQNGNRSSDELSHSSEDLLEGDGIVREELPAGKVVRRKKSNTQPPSNGNSINNNNNGTTQAPRINHRASVAKMEGLAAYLDSSIMTSSTEVDEESKDVELVLPEWIVVGESVLIRPYNTSGVIRFVGTTEFQPGAWIGVELDTPTGKNDGSVKGVQYFQCKPKHGMFVRSDKLMLDKRGKAMRAYKAAEKSNSISKEMSTSMTGSMTRSKSRGDSLNLSARK